MQWQHIKKIYKLFQDNYTTVAGLVYMAISDFFSSIQENFWHICLQKKNVECLSLVKKALHVDVWDFFIVLITAIGTQLPNKQTSWRSKNTCTPLHSLETTSTWISSPQIHLQDNAGHGDMCKAPSLPLACTNFKPFNFGLFFFLSSAI